MSSPFVQFPGTSGNYVFTDDVNLLDADTSHLIQSLGLWYETGNASVAYGIVNTAATLGYCMRATMGADGFSAVQTPTAQQIPASSSTQYSAAVTIDNDGWSGGTVTFQVVEKDITNATVTTRSLVASIPIGTTDRPTITFTTTATTTALRFYINNGSAGLNGLTADFYDIIIREGADSTFVPSLRIVGDLDLRAKAAADDWTSGNRALMSNYNGDGFLLYHDGSGYLHFESGGATSAIDESSALYTFVDGQTAEVRVTLDVSAGNLVWYESGVQVDTDTFTAQALDPGTNQLSVAADYLGTGLLFAGDIYYCEVRDGIAGPVVARFDAADVLAAL